MTRIFWALMCLVWACGLFGNSFDLTGWRRSALNGFIALLCLIAAHLLDSRLKDLGRGQ